MNPLSFLFTKPKTRKHASATIDALTRELDKTHAQMGLSKKDQEFLYKYGFSNNAYDILKATKSPVEREALMSSALMRSIEASDRSQAQDQSFLIRYGNKSWAQEIVRNEQCPIKREELAKKHSTKESNTKYPNLPQIAAQAIKTPPKPIQPAPLKSNTFATHADDVLVAMVRRKYVSQTELVEAQAELSRRNITMHKKGFSKNTK